MALRYLRIPELGTSAAFVPHVQGCSMVLVHESQSAADVRAARAWRSCGCTLRMSYPPCVGCT
eukprot:1043890-Prorocentrum_lima.AAC.1